MLAEWYNKFKKGTNGGLLDIIFVSSDANMDEWIDYFLHMPWYSLPYDTKKQVYNGILCFLAAVALLN